HCCKRDGVEPVDTFFGLIREYMGVDLRGPFNHAARIEAGFSELELDSLTRMAEGVSVPRDPNKLPTSAP
ncbi:MAG: hypothetical protein ABI389_06595, partial [Rhodanobacter sp.]